MRPDWPWFCMLFLGLRGPIVSLRHAASWAGPATLSERSLWPEAGITPQMTSPALLSGGPEERDEDREGKQGEAFKVVQSLGVAEQVEQLADIQPHSVRSSAAF